MSPGCFFRWCFLLHLYRRGFQRARISCKVRQVFPLLLPAKGTNSSFILWKGAKSSSFTREPYLSRNAISLLQMLVYVKINGPLRAASSCTRRRSLRKEFIKHSDYALPNNALLPGQAATRETWCHNFNDMKCPFTSKWRDYTISPGRMARDAVTLAA